VPDSSRWTANPCRSKCGVIGLRMPESLRAFLQASSTADVLIGLSGRSPGKSQCRDLLTRHHERRISSSVGESIT